MGICFSGYEQVDTAISECSKTVDTLNSVKWISIGGNGNPHGTITADILSSTASDADTIVGAGYGGVIFDVEVVVGINGALVSCFSSASKALKGKGLEAGIATSHSGPTSVTGGADAGTLVKGWVADPNLAVLSPQLYTTGKETEPDFATTASCTACTWDLWKGSTVAFAPSIVTSAQYADVQAYFSDNFHLTTGGYIQWKQSASPGLAPAADKMCGASWDEANADCSKSCPGGTDAECDEGQKCWGDVTGCPTALPTEEGANCPAPGDVSVQGYSAWTWSTAYGGPEGTNMGMCFSGYEKVDTAIS